MHFAKHEARRRKTMIDRAFYGGRYWDRTSDPFGVNEVLYR